MSICWNQVCVLSTYIPAISLVDSWSVSLDDLPIDLSIFTDQDTICYVSRYPHYISTLSLSSTNTWNLLHRVEHMMFISSISVVFRQPGLPQAICVGLENGSIEYHIVSNLEKKSLLELFFGLGF